MAARTSCILSRLRYTLPSMKDKPKQPFIPPEKHDTLRREILSLLADRTLSARDISAEIGISQKEVLHHLEHIRMMTRNSGERLLIHPATCKKCGFEFVKRDRLTKPGKCPVCRSEQIEEPLFSVGE